MYAGWGVVSFDGQHGERLQILVADRVSGGYVTGAGPTVTCDEQRMFRGEGAGD
ncbi:MAG: hypothetical protein ABJ327_11195 [Litoreibacter sp.]